MRRETIAALHYSSTAKRLQPSPWRLENSTRSERIIRENPAVMPTHKVQFRRCYILHLLLHCAVANQAQNEHGIGLAHAVHAGHGLHRFHKDQVRDRSQLLTPTLTVHPKSTTKDRQVCMLIPRKMQALCCFHSLNSINKCDACKACRSDLLNVGKHFENEKRFVL